MGKESRTWSEPSSRSVTVLFGQRPAAPSQFDRLFRQGMELVERAAAYLDGEGRQEAKRLKGATALAYATESMRLTTRLLDLASWLLIRRSLNEGEITEEEARAKSARLRLRTTGRPSHIVGFHELPPTLRNLIEESFAIADRILRMDSSPAPGERGGPGKVNPVAAQIARLQAAFNAAIR
jgi:regulator of CtrA degradation